MAYEVGLVVWREPRTRPQRETTAKELDERGLVYW